MKVLVLLAMLLGQWTVNGTSLQQAAPKDTRPPVVSVRIKDQDLALLESAKREVEQAEYALQAAKNVQSVAEQKVIDSYRTEELPKAEHCHIWGGSAGYLATIENGYIIYKLGYLECHPV